jgi:hypothetical protein
MSMEKIDGPMGGWASRAHGGTVVSTGAAEPAAAIIQGHLPRTPSTPSGHLAERLK